jgi:hypothetical protein
LIATGCIILLIGYAQTAQSVKQTRRYENKQA